MIDLFLSHLNWGGGTNCHRWLLGSHSFRLGGPGSRLLARRVAPSKIHEAFCRNVSALPRDVANYRLHTPIARQRSMPSATSKTRSPRFSAHANRSWCCGNSGTFWRKCYCRRPVAIAGATRLTSSSWMPSAACYPRTLGRFRALRVIWARWNGERECGARTSVHGRPDAAMMTLDDRAAQRQPNPHALRLGAVE